MSNPTQKQIRLVSEAREVLLKSNIWGHCIVAGWEPSGEGVRLSIQLIERGHNFIVRIVLEAYLSNAEIWLACRKMLDALSRSYSKQFLSLCQPDPDDGCDGQ